MYINIYATENRGTAVVVEHKEDGSPINIYVGQPGSLAYPQRVSRVESEWPFFVIRTEAGGLLSIAESLGYPTTWMGEEVFSLATERRDIERRDKQVKIPSI